MNKRRVGPTVIAVLFLVGGLINLLRSPWPGAPWYFWLIVAIPTLLVGHALLRRLAWWWMAYWAWFAVVLAFGAWREYRDGSYGVWGAVALVAILGSVLVFLGLYLRSALKNGGTKPAADDVARSTRIS